MITLDEITERGFKPLSLNRNPKQPRMKSIGSLLTTKKDRLYVSPIYEKQGAQYYGEPIQIKGFSVISRKGLRELVNNATNEIITAIEGK